MASVLLPVMLLLLTVTSTLLIFMQKRLLHTVILLALTATASALIILYIGQLLIALLQMLVFVGGLSTYLVVAVAAEEKHAKIRNAAGFAIATLALVAILTLLLFNVPQEQASSATDFSAAAQIAFQQYYGLFFVAVFLLFACAIGSVLVLKRFSRLVI